MSLGLCCSQLLNVVFGQVALAVCDKHDVGILKSILLNEPQRLIQRRMEIGAAVKKRFCRADLIFHAVLFRKKDIRFEAAGT